MLTPTPVQSLNQPNETERLGTPLSSTVREAFQARRLA